MATDQVSDDDLRNIRDELEELYLADQDETKRRGGVSLWHTPQKSPNRRLYQAAQELLACCECARSLHERGIVDIREVESNPERDGFPDCFARLDGKRIGIEATELTDADNAHREWCRDSFERELASTISKKDRKAGIPRRAERVASLDHIFLVVFTDEADLTRERIGGYLKQIRIPKPSRIDRIFFLGPFEAGNNAVTRGRQYEPIEHKARYTAFQARCSQSSRTPHK